MNDLSQDFAAFIAPAVLSVPIPIASIWYLLRLHPNHDLKAERQLTDQGISVYVPKEQKTLMSRRLHRKVKKTVAIFPGTMFVPDFEADIGRLKRLASGVGGFVRYNGEALKVRPHAMDEIRKFEAKQNRDPERRRFKRAQQVRIVDGPFALFEGPIEKLDKDYRLSVLIQWLGCLSPIQFDEDQVEAV
jgi:transcription antitermination factor NusG